MEISNGSELYRPLNEMSLAYSFFIHIPQKGVKIVRKKSSHKIN